ncbi:hypothetical protein U1Q18_025129 [Sarracenia purpurea var. burkii]
MKWLDAESLDCFFGDLFVNVGFFYLICARKGWGCTPIPSTALAVEIEEQMSGLVPGIVELVSDTVEVVETVLRLDVAGIVPGSVVDFSMGARCYFLFSSRGLSEWSSLG